MKTTIIIALFAGAAAGAGTATLSGVLMSDDSAGENLTAVDPTDDTDALFGLVALLREENLALTDRMQTLESRVAMATVQRMPAGAAPSEEMDDPAAVFAASDKPPTPREMALVRNVIDQIEAEEQARRAEERRVREDERLDQQIDRLTEQLGLDPAQAKSMRDILANQNIRRTEMFAAMRDGAGGGMDRGKMGEAFREMTEATNALVQNVLSPTQYETYGETNNNRGFGRDFGGMRGGGRGDR